MYYVEALATDVSRVFQIRKKSFLNHKTLVVNDVKGHAGYEKRQRGFFRTKKALFNLQTSQQVWETGSHDNTTQARTFFGSNRIVKLRSGATHALSPLNSLIRSAHHSFCWDADHYNWLPTGNGDHAMTCYRAATGCEVAEFIPSPVHSSSAIGTLVIHEGKLYSELFCEFLIFSFIELWEIVCNTEPAPSVDTISLPVGRQTTPINGSNYITHHPSPPPSLHPPHTSTLA
ncbi:hypothetical protein IWQ61_006903 [Dispira simplex]|nr:hypothetical protein IWQ61_006903 [Dispira simplex]